MKNFFLIVIAGVLIFQNNSSADNLIENKSLCISALIPDSWKASQVNDSHLVFKDTTRLYRSQIVIKKHIRNSLIYVNPSDWTRAHFIAYLLVVQNSYDPAGAVLYFDSTATSQQDFQWAPEAFSQFYTIDTSIGSWNEYIRFTSFDNFGFEIYAIGDTVDMKKNIDYYVDIIHTIKFPNKSISNKVIKYFAKGELSHKNAVATYGIYDLLGKSYPQIVNRASGIYLRPDHKTMQSRVK